MESKLKLKRTKSPLIRIKRIPSCQKCGQHGLKARLKGHKGACPYKECECAKCSVISERQKLMAKQIKIRRQQRKELKNGLQNHTEEDEEDDEEGDENGKQVSNLQSQMDAVPKSTSCPADMNFVQTQSIPTATEPSLSQIPPVQALLESANTLNMLQMTELTVPSQPTLPNEPMLSLPFPLETSLSLPQLASEIPTAFWLSALEPLVTAAPAVDLQMLQMHTLLLQLLISSNFQ